MPNDKVRAAGEAVPDNPRNPQPFAWVRAFFRKVPMPWHARAENAVVTEASVQESFMNQHVDRRALLASSAAATAVLATAAAKVTAEISPELERLIAAKRRTEVAFDDALDANYETEQAYFAAHSKELFVDLSIGGAQSFHPDFERDLLHSDVRAEIVRRYDEQRRRLAPIAKLDPTIGASAMDALKAGQARDLRAFRQVLRGEIGRRKAFGYWQVEEARAEASQADLNAFTDLCAYRCTNFAELKRKAEVLAHYTGPQFSEIQAEDFQILLASMMPAGAREVEGAKSAA